MQITAFGLTYLLFGGLFSWLVLIVPLTTLLRYLAPRWFLEKYFCEPYFTYFEMRFYSGIPYYLLRTQMFMWAINFPSRIRKRGIENIREGLPSWFIWVNRIYMWWFIVNGGGVVFLLVSLLLYTWFFPSVNA
jgi:hypothetical protein